MKPNRRIGVALAALLAALGLLTAAAARPGEDSRGGLEEAAPRTRCDPSRAVKVVPDARGIYFSAYPETVGVDAGPGSPTKHRRQIARFNTLAGKRLAFSMCSTRCWAAGSSSLQGGTRGVGFGRRAADLDSAPLELEHASGNPIRSSRWRCSPEETATPACGAGHEPREPAGFRCSWHAARRCRRAGQTSHGCTGRVSRLPRQPGTTTGTCTRATVTSTGWAGRLRLLPAGRIQPVEAVPFSDGPAVRAADPACTQEAAAARAQRRLQPVQGDMPAWIGQAYRELAGGRWPKVKIVNWWQQHYPGTTSAIDVTPGVLRAFRQAVADPRFREDVRFRCSP